jgi:RIO-like serine/threonine protein kinase
MSRLPFQISIECSLPKQGRQILECMDVLRSIAGVRDVYDAVWNGRAVIVKVFANSFKSAHHIKREWEGLSRLAKIGIDAPQPLFVGKTEDGRAAIVIEKISDSKTALDIFNKAENKNEKLRLLLGVCRKLAGQNSKGVLQKDLHLGNFLISEDKIYVIDTAQMKFFPNALNKNHSTSQLALLCCCLPHIESVSVRRLLEEYFDEREWAIGQSDEKLLIEKVSAYRKVQIKKGLRKLLRTGTRQIRIKAGKFRAVFDRSFVDGINIEDFFEKMDSMMNSGRILKRGNTCYVSRLSLNDRDIVIKRYNYKGFFHSIRNTIKGSRARRGWLFGHLLEMLNVPTPKPLGYIEARNGLLVVRSYIVMEFVDGTKLEQFLQGEGVSEQKRSQIKQQIIELLDRLAFYKVTHGDLKHTNILINGGRLVLTDLDSMRLRKSKFSYRLFRDRDIELFARGKRDGSVIFDNLIE